MPFSKVETQADFPALERQVLQFWAERGIFEKRRELNRNGPRWSFLDGPITANNPMGVHHAWGRTYKDVFCRYFALTGHHQRYQNGFDCQGLWVEVEVEKELKLKSKRDIEEMVPGDREASIAKFVQLCKDRVDQFARVQTDQSIRLGMWMDWDRTDEDWKKPVDERKSYFTMSNKNNYTIWSFLKKCHGKGLIYRGYDAMPWCGRCGVGLSEMEVKEGYKTIEHRAVFVKFPLVDQPGKNLLAWTTTPWTLTSNVAAAVNPELTYIEVKLKDQIYYVAEGAFKFDRMSGGSEEGEVSRDTQGSAKRSKRDWLDGVPHLKSIEQLFKEKAGKEKYEITGIKKKGADMIGWKYTGPFDDLEAQNVPGGYPAKVAEVFLGQNAATAKSARTAHCVISWNDVGDTEGTGIVHIAPGCGQVDLLLCQILGFKDFPVVAPLDDSGCFLPHFGCFSGKNASESTTVDLVFDELKKNDLLFAIERYVHRYPHCWRCKTELLFRLVDEWFISMGQKPTLQHRSVGDHVFPVREKWEPSFRTDIKKVVEQVEFLPESLNGQAREIDWLRNMGDWMISKKRFWGLALPIWVDDATGEFEVIGSREELKARAVEGWDEFEGNSPHRPYVDRVKIRNATTGNLMSRIPDVGNPWLDAGIVAFSTMSAEWRPADFITESFPGQFRNWFYALLSLSTMMSDGEPPFKTLLGFATVKDQFGHEMHKTAGNSIEFIAAADKGGTLKDPKGNDLPFNAIGADVMRWLYCRQSPAQNLNFGPAPADEVRSKFIFKLWNTYAFFCNCAIGDGFDPSSKEQLVPVENRPDLDRWILAGLQELIVTARKSFEAYDAMGFALAAERYVEDDLSNWYVRRVKGRLNSKVADLDPAGLTEKWAAYQTLYTVLTTLCRCLAPCIPFLTETLWQNLKAHGAQPVGLESVHLTEYPKADESLRDAKLISQMDALREVITLGGAARNVGKVSVRQPLLELIIGTASDEEVGLLQPFVQLIRDELNVKDVQIVWPDNPRHFMLINYMATLNKKTAAAKLGAKFKEVEIELAIRDPYEIKTLLQQGPVEICGFLLDTNDISTSLIWPAGYAAAMDGRGRKVRLATRITDELKREGLARNIVRMVNQARKEADLDIADAIELHLHSPSAELMKAIQTHRDEIATEVQATKWSDSPLGESAHQSVVKIDGQSLTVEFRKL